jgi:putative hydrolase of the HAD superfamily
MFDVIAFDADDTLWHNEPIYRGTQRLVIEILAHYHDSAEIESRMYQTELRNLEHYGYGIKGFTLSMIETAIELTAGRITGREVERILELTREMFRAPVDLLEDVRETIALLGGEHSLMLITKGDLFEQEGKIARSGLADFFDRIEIVPVKTRRVYETLASKHKIDPARFLMVGNSIRSDVLPVIEMGARAVHIPYETTWEHELVPVDELAGKEFFQVSRIRDLPSLLDGLRTTRI